VGTITVTATAAQDSAKSFTFTLNVNTVAKTVKAAPASGEIGVGYFLIDDIAWRVLAKRVGTAYSAGGNSVGNGMDVLILPVAADAFGKSQFHKENSGNYSGSDIRNFKLTSVFDSLYWAHDYAIKPGEQHTPASIMPTGYGDLGSSFTNSNNDGGISVSTNTFAIDVPGHLDGCFLLSWNETYRMSQIYGWTGNGNNGGADRRRAANNVDGTIARYFLRSTHEPNSYVDGVLFDGSGFYTGSASSGYGKTGTQGFRPAMILRLPVEYTVHYYLQGSTTPVAPDKHVDDLMLNAGVTTVTENALDIDSYTLVSNASLTQTFAANNDAHEFIFYYEAE
jgi:hypothetical protein